MRTTTCVRAAGVAVLLAAAGLAAGQAPEFKLYASTEGRFTIDFPGPVKTETVPVKSDNAELKLTVDVVELRGGVSFLVTFIDTPDDAAGTPAATRLDKIRDGNKGPTGKLVSEKDVTVGAEKYPARDLLIEKGDVFLRNRIVLAGNRLYQVMVQGPKDVVTSASADRFIQSFEVTK
jgi:hypothetical protein